MTVKHAGIHWPENAGGEHPNVETILGMPGINHGCTLICSPSARYWYHQARGASPLVVWRAIPRRGKLPAQLGWDAMKVAEECLNLWDEQPHDGAEWFTPLNELQFCLVPDQKVTALSPTLATMRRYEGDIVIIKTTTGNQVACTPNHPILTRQGWLPAGQIHEGSEVAQRAFSDTRLGRIDRPDDVDVPTPISEVFRTLNRGRSTVRVGLPVVSNFHGDRVYGNVDVVGANGFLGHALSESFQQFPLVVSDSELSALSTQRSLISHLGRFALAAPRCPSPAQVFCTGAPEFSGVASGSSRPTMRFERQQERGRHGSCEPVSGLSGGVTFVQVAEVVIRQFDGHVYGLSTEDECIYADSIVTHNSKENGAPFPGYGPMAQNLAQLRPALRQEFSNRGQRVRLIWPAWVPSDDMDHLLDWHHEAVNWDAIGLHAYGSAETQRMRYDSYRAAFPDHPIFVGEWNANHEGHDERAILQMWADVANTDPGLLGVTYYIWETNNAGERDLSIWGNPDRLDLFMHPPVAEEPEEPVEPDVPEYKFGFKAKADELGAAVVGAPLENEYYIGDHHSLQMTEKGVMIYSKEANEVKFLAGQ